MRKTFDRGEAQRRRRALRIARGLLALSRRARIAGRVEEAVRAARAGRAFLVRYVST
jgi:hypothetical protein